MRFIDVKKASDVQLEGVTAFTDSNNTRLVRLRLVDAKGRELVITPANQYESVQAVVTAPPVLKTKYRLVGEVLGVRFEATFDEKLEADAKLRELAGSVINEDGVSLTIEAFQVPEEE